jgi:diacylglycerol kinase family enzyme
MRNRQVQALPEVSFATVEAIDDRPFPVQVDGDYIGDFAEVDFGVTPAGLMAVA